MSDRIPAFLRIAAIPVLCCLLGSAPGAMAADPSAPAASEDKNSPDAATRRLTLEAYAEMQKAADEAWRAPEGPERIAKCEAFLKAHPDYPRRRDLLGTLIEDSLKAGGFEPAAMAARIESYVSLSDSRNVLLEDPDLFLEDPAGRVDQYYFRYGLPLESAQRLIDAGWRRIAQVRREGGGKKGQARGQYEQMKESALSEGERLLRLDEARVKLARGDAAGALEMLRESGKGESSGGTRILLRDRVDGKVRAISLPGSDWYEMTLARAYASLGKRPQAQEHLERVLAFGEIPPDLRDAVAKLRSEQGVPAPEGAAFRGEPVQAPELVLKDLEGKESKLGDYKGRVVLLVFWTTW